MHPEIPIPREVVVFLAAAGIAVPIMHRLRISAVLGFLVIGLVVGPYGLGRLTSQAPWLGTVVISDIEGVRALAELGVVFLLFMIGLELSLSRLMSMRQQVFGLGGAQVVVSATVIAAIAYLFGNTEAASLVIGACLALSSTAIVMQILIESRRFSAPVGQTSFAILLFQDLAVVPILFMTGVLGAKSGGSVALPLALAIGKAAVAIVIIMAAGRTVVRPVFRLVGQTQSRELFMATVLLIVIGTAAITAEAGLSLSLGAFLAGLLLAETEYRHQIEIDIEPFKGLLLGLFFMSVGMTIDVTAVLDEPLWIPLSVIGLLTIKTAITFVLARLFGHSISVSAESSLLLGQGGEFAFVVLAAALVQGLLPASTVQFMLIVTSLSMLATPAVARVARVIGKRLENNERRDGAGAREAVAQTAGHVIVAGYGRVGQLLGSLLDTRCIPHVGVDVDPNIVERLRRNGVTAYYGDASRPELLRRLGIDRASALVITMDAPAAAERVVAAARSAWPQLPILARARDIKHARRLLALGATDVVPETIEASFDLAEVVLASLGHSPEASRQLVAERREEERLALREDRASRRRRADQARHE
ncbi:MAG: monovalent cation:proton antiporter-2 (CPA2) family protein [Pseudomonadota bacterium]